MDEIKRTVLSAPLHPLLEEREGGEDGPDRRCGFDRRSMPTAASDYEGPERRTASVDDTGLERRRGPGRRLADARRIAEEGEMTSEQFEFLMAIETYKKVNKKMYPTWTEVMEIVTQLGYRKVVARDIKLTNVPEPAFYTPSEQAPAPIKKAA